MNRLDVVVGPKFRRGARKDQRDESIDVLNSKEKSCTGRKDEQSFNKSQKPDSNKWNPCFIHVPNHAIGRRECRPVLL